MKIKQTARYYGQGYAQVIRTVSEPIPDPVLGTVTMNQASALTLRHGIDIEGLHQTVLCHPLDRKGVVSFGRSWTRPRLLRIVKGTEDHPISARERLWQRCSLGCL